MGANLDVREVWEGAAIPRAPLLRAIDSRRIVVKLIKEHGTHLQFLLSALYSFSLYIHNCYMFIGTLVVVNACEPRYSQICLTFPVLVHELLNLGALIQVKNFCIMLDSCYYLPFQLLNQGLRVGGFWHLVFGA